MPQEIRNRVMDENLEFCTAISEYLDGVCVRQFLTGTKDEVGEKVQHKKKVVGYINPTRTLPEKVLPTCETRCGTCTYCEANRRWWKEFRETTDDILW